MWGLKKLMLNKSQTKLNEAIPHKKIFYNMPENFKEIL